MLGLPPTVSRLVLFFLLAAPLFALAAPAPVAAPEAAPAAAPLDAPSKLNPRAPQPSKRMGQRRAKKPEPVKKKDYSSFLCPGGSVACPVPPADLADVTPASVAALETSLSSLADWFRVGFECIELETELNSCGGCLALGKGQDCTAIPNTRATGCEASSCVVYSCKEGYVVAPDRQTCVRRGTATPATPVTAVGLDSDADVANANANANPPVPDQVVLTP
ncbi:Protein cpl1 [Cryptotrichosporon argae]